MFISFAVTAYEEMTDAREHGGRLLKSISAATKHPAVEEVVIVDDWSGDYAGLQNVLANTPKLCLYRNEENQGVFGNKIEAILRCTGDWVITCDSDNFMDEGYIDKIVSLDKKPDTWYCPSFARPNFDYRKLVGKYNLSSIGEMIQKPMAQCFCNTGNQTVHRETFAEVFSMYRGRRADLMLSNWLDLTPEQRPMKYWRLVFDALDSFILNWLWLHCGKTLHIVPGLEYDHYYSGGLESNYARSPKEKDDLGRILFDKLKRSSETCHTTSR